MEEPGSIKYLTECDVPAEEYNEARMQNLVKRHPKLSPRVPDHYAALESFLDVSIMAGFSYGANKAQIFATEASLLGHHVNREGSSHEEEKTQTIVDFTALKDVTQVRQFTGCTNWVRRYLQPQDARHRRQDAGGIHEPEKRSFIQEALVEKIHLATRQSKL